MSEYDIKEAVQEILRAAKFYDLNEDYLLSVIKNVYSEGFQDGKIALLQEQIAEIEVVTGK
jgi:hypothetical protein